MDWKDGENKRFLKKGIDNILKGMKKKRYDLYDKRFDGFEKWCGKNKINK